MEQQLDLRNPSISSIWNFFWYLFHDLNRCPSTIEGYRAAIADTLGNSNLHISSNTDIARLIASFYRDKPKVSRSLPKWNLSLVLQKLIQPPFEPNEECTLKLLTWKTVFLLALASGKRHSEIHAWTYDGTLSLGDWDQVQLTPSPSFIAKNQQAKEGPNIISPVIIKSLKCDQDPQNTDILLCPVKALKCYLDRTKDSRSGRQLLFVSYKLGQHEEKGAYHNLLAELYDFDVPGFTNFMRMTPEFFEMIKQEYTHTWLGKQRTTEGHSVLE